MGVATVPLGYPSRLGCLLAVGCLLGTRTAMAFPVTDEATPAITTNTPAPTEGDLRHQLQLQQNGLGGFGAAASAGGWTILPSIEAEEFYTDNVLATETNRRWDLVTILTPGVTVLGDEPNAQVTLNYTPQFRLDATTPQENSITQQLAATGLFTLIPDELYVDARALAGATPITAGFGALGTTLTPTIGQLNNGVQNLPKQNLSQNSSLSISPYWLHRFGDTGVAKLGYEFNETSISPETGAVPLFFPSAGSQHSATNEAVAQFETGDRFTPFRDLVVLNASQSNGTGVANGASAETISNQLGYIVNRSWEVYGEIGYENLRFGGTPPTSISDVTWGVGAIWTPNPDSQITLGYGHQDGVSGVQLSGYYALSSRTRLTASYTTGLQTDLGELQGQLDLASLTQNGQAVDALTGAPLFTGFNGLGAQTGLYRAKNFDASISTSLDRDDYALTFQWSQQTTIATAGPVVAGSPFNATSPPVGSTGQSSSAFLTWDHQINDDLSLNAGVSYGISSITSTTGVGTGRQTSVAANIGLQYVLSETVVTSARYAFFQQFSPQPGDSIYQNLVLVSITKQF